MAFERITPRIQQSISGPLNKKIFFLHLPKCGGTSLDDAFRACYRTLNLRNDKSLPRYDSMAAGKASSILHGMNYLDGDVKDYDYLRFGVEYSTYQMSIQSNKYLSGHICFDNTTHHAYGDTYDYVTLLRDPVKRWISFFFYVKYRSADRYSTVKTIEEYIDSNFGQSQGHEYVKYLGGTRKDGCYSSAEAINDAKENLKNFKLTGCLENLDSFSSLFKDIYGKNLAVSSMNKSPAPNKHRSDALTPTVLDKIKEICKPDYEIYDYLRKSHSR